MQTVVELSTFKTAADQSGLSGDDVEAIKDLLAREPGLGSIMPGTGGLRKIRFGAQGRGKRGGYRVITFFSGSKIPVFLITVYGKNETDEEDP